MMRCTCRGACLAGALLLVSLPAAAQDGVPDNSRIDLNITDDPSNQYRQTLEERERQDEEAARESGGANLPMLVGPGEERREEVPAEPLAVAEPEPRAPERTVPPARVEVSVPRGEGSEDGLGLAIGLLFEQWNRAPNVVRIVYGSEAEDDAAGEAAADVDGNGTERSRAPSASLPGWRLARASTGACSMA